MIKVADQYKARVTPKRQNRGYFRIVHKPTGASEGRPQSRASTKPRKAVGEIPARTGIRMYKFCIEQI